MSNNDSHGIHTNPVRVWVPIHTEGPIGKGMRCHKYPILDAPPVSLPDDERIAYVECAELGDMTRRLCSEEILAGIDV